MESKAITMKIFDSKTNESVIIITNVKKSRFKEFVPAKGSF